MTPERKTQSLLGRLPRDVVMRPDVLPVILADHEHRIATIESSTTSVSPPTDPASQLNSISYGRLLILIILLAVASGKTEWIIARILPGLQ